LHAVRGDIKKAVVCASPGDQMQQDSNVASISGETFKSLMRTMASSVAVITTRFNERAHGMTATAVCSVSADPATILIVVNRSTRSHPIISASKRFTVNILAEYQRELGGRFASKHPDPFDGVEHHDGVNGSPIIDGASAYIECVTTAEIESGTHTIFIGNIVGGNISGAYPLVYHEGEYKSVTSRWSDRAIASMFLDRWSPRAFAEYEIDDERLLSFFEAARWAPSSMNAQPWRFIYVKRSGANWDGFLNALSDTNRLWAAKAAALVAFVSKETLEYRGEQIESPTHSFDTGAAWMSFALQASLSGWHTHGMAGFDSNQLRQVLAVSDGFAINAVAAIGKLGDGESLPNHLRQRESPSEREPLKSLVFEGSFKSVGLGGGRQPAIK
jgi:flavin reductase (DIM6/NTAB) family NADH-FMN oxidoreductase RutF/nitroreductase